MSYSVVIVTGKCHDLYQHCFDILHNVVFKNLMMPYMKESSIGSSVALIARFIYL